MNNANLYKLAQQADKTIGDNLKLFKKRNIKKFILQRSISINPVFWNNGVLSWAINRYNELAIDTLETGHNKKNISKSHSPRLVDDLLFFYANYETLTPSEKEHLYTFLATSTRDANDVILYRDNVATPFIDTLGMICPFLIKYGLETETAEAIKMGIHQIKTFLKYAQDEKSGLPYHGYNPSGNKLGIIGWGRGIGWILVAISESLSLLNKDSPHYKELRPTFDLLLSNIMKYIKEDGSFSWQLQAQEGPSDTSATSMIGYSIARHNNAHDEDTYKAELNSMQEYICSNIDNSGRILNSSAECGGFSIYPQKFEYNSWGQGFSILFLLETEKKT